MNKHLLVLAALCAIGSAHAGGWGGGAGAAMEGFNQGRRDAGGGRNNSDNREYETATSTGQRNSSMGMSTCDYQTQRGFSFSVNTRQGFCASSVKIDPVSMTVVPN